MASDNSMIIHPIQNSDQVKEVLSFLSQDVMCNLYQIDAIQRMWNHPFSFLSCSFVTSMDTIVACALVSDRPIQGLLAGMIVPYGEANACRLLGAHELRNGGARHLYGERAATVAFYEGMGTPKVRYSYKERLFYSSTFPTVADDLSLRPARMDEVEQLLPMTQQMHKEDLGESLSDNAASYKRALLLRISEERILIGEDQGEIVFVIDIGTRSSLGVQIGSAFVPQHCRRRGYGVRGMRGCQKYFLEHSKMVTLVARESNIPAVATHHRAGFIPKHPFQLILIDT